MVSHDGAVVTVDCQYIEPERAAAYLLIEEDRAAFVDNNTIHAVPILMDALANHGLTPEQVDYLFVTHIHLDHAGGTAALLARCPNARVIAHPRAARHLVDPSRLVESAMSLYGRERFEQLYGSVEPVPAERIETVEDEAIIGWGQRKLRFLHTRGHANHHYCIYDDRANGLFSGDSFGVAYPALQRDGKPFVIWSCPPTDFDPGEARKTVQRVMDSGAQRVFVSHFGPYSAMSEGAAQMLWYIDEMDRLLQEATASEAAGEELEQLCMDGVAGATTRALEKAGLDPADEATWRWVDGDARLNALGVAFAAQRRRRKAG